MDVRVGRGERSRSRARLREGGGCCWSVVEVGLSLVLLRRRKRFWVFWEKDVREDVGAATGRLGGEGVVVLVVVALAVADGIEVCVDSGDIGRDFICEVLSS